MGKPKKKKDFFVNPLKNKNIGWRTGKDLLAGKIIRVNEQGVENLEDYYSESDADFTQDLTVNNSRMTRSSKEFKYKSIDENKDPENEAQSQSTKFESSQSGQLGSSQSSNMFAWLKNKNIGRRTGKDVLAGKVITKNSHGFDNIEDYFSESSDAESMFMSKSRISVGLDSTDVAMENSTHPDSCIPSTVSDDQVSYNSSESIYKTNSTPSAASLATPTCESSDGEGDTPTNKMLDSCVNTESLCRPDSQTLFDQEVKGPSNDSLENQEMSSDEEIQFKTKSTEKSRNNTMLSEQIEKPAVADIISKDIPVSDKLTTVTAITEKLTETTTVMSKTSEVTALTEKSTKSYVSNTINIGGNVTGSLTKTNEPSLDSTGPIPSFKTRKKLSFSALEKSFLKKEVQKNKRRGSKISPVVNSNPFNKSGTKSTRSSVVGEESSVQDSLNSTYDVAVEEEFGKVNDNSLSKSGKTKQQSKGGVKVAEKSHSQQRKSNKKRTSKAREEENTVGESEVTEKVETAKSGGKRKSQIGPTVSLKEMEESIEKNSQYADGTSIQKSLKRKSVGGGLKRKSVGDGLKTKKEQIVKSVEKRKSQISSTVATKVDESCEESSQKPRRTSKLKTLKRKSSFPSKTSNQSVVIDKENEGSEDLGDKQTKSKKGKSASSRKRVVSQINEPEKVEYLYDSDNSSLIINEYEKEIEKKMKSRTKSSKSTMMLGKHTKSLGGDQNLPSDGNIIKKRRTFVLGDDDMETNETLERSQMDNAKSDNDPNVTNLPVVTNSGNKIAKKRGRSCKSLPGKTSCSVDINRDGNTSDNALEDNLVETEGSVIKKPLKRIGRNSRKYSPQVRSTSSPVLNVTGNRRVGKKQDKHSKKSISVPTRLSKDDLRNNSFLDTDNAAEADGDVPFEYLSDRDISDANALEKQEENRREKCRPKRAVSSNKKLDQKTKGQGLLKQTLSKAKSKKGVARKNNVLKSGKSESKKGSKVKSKIQEKKEAANETNDVSESNVSKAKGRRKQKISIGCVDTDSLKCSLNISQTSSTCSKIVVEASDGINQNSNSPMADDFEEQEVNRLDTEENVSTVQSSQKNKLSSRKRSMSNKKSNKRKSGKDRKSEVEDSDVKDIDSVPPDNDIPMLSLSKKSGLGLLASTMQSPQGSYTPFSATPGSEFTLTRREEMFRSGVSFRQLKVERSAKKSTSKKSSRISLDDKDDDIDDDKDDESDVDDQDVHDEGDYEDEKEDDIAQELTDNESREVQEVSVGYQNTSTRQQSSGTGFRPTPISGASPKSSLSPENLTPCLVTPGRKSASKGRRVTINHQVTEAVYDVPSDLSSSDTPVSSKNRRRSSIPGGDQTTYISMSSTPIHACERTTTETPKPFQKPEKSKIILPDPLPPNGLRRSQRTRVQTLEWYKNERVDYKYRKSGGFVIGGIIPSQEAKILELEQKKRKNLRKGHKKQNKKRKNVGSPPRNLSMHVDIPSDLNLTVSDEIPVINPETEEEVLVECFASKDSGVFVGPSGKQPTPEDPFVMSRVLDQRGFGTGVLLLRPLQEKTIQMVSRGTLIFLLDRGVITMTVHKTSVVMEAGDSAFVPRGNAYSMKNLRSEEAKLSYTVLKESFDESDA